MAFNIPDDCVNHPNAPWNEDEWHCPECYGHMDDVKCEPWNELCQEEYFFDCMNWLDDCECEGEE